MSVSAVGSAPIAPMTSERAEVGPDHDGDSDDAGVAVQQQLQAPKAPGTGLVVDKTA